MRPAFLSPHRAVAFICLLVFLLVLPILLAKSGAMDRRDAYLTVTRNAGPYPWIYQQIFVETNDVDIAFVGSSRMMADVSPRYVRDELAHVKGSAPVVFSLAWNFGGYDALYTITRDFLEHRRVRMIVVYDDLGDSVHPYAEYWMRMGEQSDARAGLPLPVRAALYGSEVLGAPRYLLTALSHPRFDPHWDTTPYFIDKNGANFKNELGANCKRFGMGADPATFVPFIPGGLATPTDALIYSTATQAAFAFPDNGANDYQIHFARLFVELCRQHHTRIVGLYLPALSDKDSRAMTWRPPWREFAAGSATLTGIPASALFRGLSAADVEKLYFNDAHMNVNGQRYFTSLITPVLLKLYANSTNRF